MEYRTDFKVIKKNGAEWLMDGDKSVLFFDPDSVRFCGCRLRPGGPEMFGRTQENFYTGGWFVPFWGGCHFGGSERLVSEFSMRAERDRASIRLVSRSSSGVVETDWRMDISYSEELKSYLYEVETIAEVYREADPGSYNCREFEYFDLFPTGLIDQKTAPVVFRPDGRVPAGIPGPRWDYLVYEKDDDVYSEGHYTVIKAPLNRFITSAQNNIRVKRDGRIGFMNNPAGNPVIQLVGDTAAVSRMDLCNWFYDLHFNHDLKFVEQPPRKGLRVSAKFNLSGYGFESSLPLLEEAVAPAFHEKERAAKAFPRLELAGLNSFEEGVSIDVPDHSKIWRPFSNHPVYYDFGLSDVDAYNTPESECLWDRKTGRTGTCSLKVRTTRSRVAGWALQGFEAVHVAPSTPYRVSVYVRTRKMEGRGACMGIYAGPYSDRWKMKEPEDFKLQFCERWITGDSRWERLEITIPGVKASLSEDSEGRVHQLCNIQVVFWHEGKGESWFDDFSVEKLRAGEGNGGQPASTRDMLAGKEVYS